MALFDTVRCEYPLPDPAHQGLDFRTRDLERWLDTYTITRSGRLVRHARPGPIADVEWPIHGDLRIWQSVELPGGVEYVVRFVHGRVESVRRSGGPERDVPSPTPELTGRPLTADEFAAHGPEKLELVDGRIPGDERLLLLLLTSRGLRRAVELVGRERWKKAVGED